MSAITGRAKKYDGSKIDYVLLFDWVTGDCIGKAIPDVSGLWSFPYFTTIKVGITYVADGCEPITHGAYDFVINWNPNVIAPKLYLDTESAIWSGGVGSNITAWQDLSDTQSDFLPGGSVTKTADGAVSIPSGNNYLYNDTTKAKSMLSGIGKAWVFMVVKPKANDITLFMVTDTSGKTFNPRLAILYERGLFNIYQARNDFNGSVPYQFDSSPQSANEYHMVLLEVDWQSGRIAWHINGVLDTFDDNKITDKGLTNAAQADNRVYIGQYATAGSSVPHDFKSLAVYTDYSLTQDDIDKLFGFAAHKHDLTDKLLSDHPYKTEPPI